MDSGSLYTSESVVTLRGINIFMDNISPCDTIDFQCLEDDVDNYWFRGSGGAIYCKSSTLNINSEYSVFAINIAKGSGGAIDASFGNITIKGSVTFMENLSFKGGAISLFHMTLRVSGPGNISFINNKAYFGGALSMLHFN